MDNGIHFEQQKEFPYLLGTGGFPLLFDFYLPSKSMLIEVNGSQHYIPIEYFGGEEKFRRLQEHDRRKREYAKDNGYDLLVIKCPDYYSPDFITSILQNSL